MTEMTSISLLQPADRGRWTELWRAYLTFYDTTLPETTYRETWRRLSGGSGPIYGLGIRRDDEPDAPLVGIVHYLFHSTAWAPTDVCYLQDLYVDAAFRGTGRARRLIEAVKDAAREHRCGRLYWMTHTSNATARRLYDTMAQNNGFIEYECPLM